MHEGLAGKGDQADAAAGMGLDEIQDCELRAFETVRADVSGEHALRAIQNQHEVFALKIGGPGLVQSPLRPGEGQTHAREEQRDENIFQRATITAVRTEQVRAQFRFDESVQLFRPRPRRVKAEAREGERSQHSQQEPGGGGEMGMREVHGLTNGGNIEHRTSNAEH